MHFEEVYAQYFRKVYSFVLSLSRNEHTAEEITQETFFRVMKHPEAFQGQSSVNTYLCSIAHNLYISGIRRQKRQVSSIGTEETPDPKDLSLDYESKDTIMRLHVLLHQMEEPYKEVFSLRVFGELPFAEIGSVFGKSDSWARVTYFRAKQRLQQQLEEENNERK